MDDKDSRVSLRDKLDELVDARDKLTCAQIDAGACRTRTDYSRAQRAEEAFEDAYNAFMDLLMRVIIDLELERDALRADRDTAWRDLNAARTERDKALAALDVLCVDRVAAERARKSLAAIEAILAGADED